jgi:hypothetical protein
MWTDTMAGLCGQLAGQAKGVVSAHKWAISQHPTDAAVTEINNFYTRNKSQGGYFCKGHTKKPALEDDICNGRFNCGKNVLWVRVIDVCEWIDKDENTTNGKKNLEKRHSDAQKKSEETLVEYRKRAAVPLPPMSPPKPPGAYYIPDPADVPDTPDIPDIPTDGGGTGLPQMPMMPSLPMTPSTPATPDTQSMLDNAMKKAGAGAPKGGVGGVKPASVGGAGGMGGMPKLPLGASGDGGETSARPAAAAPGVNTAGLGKGLPGAGAGGGMGGMPMSGAGGGGDKGAKGNRVKGAEEDALYTEERAWTEGVIGNRPRKAPGPHDK